MEILFLSKKTTAPISIKTSGCGCCERKQNHELRNGLPQSRRKSHICHVNDTSWVAIRIWNCHFEEVFLFGQVGQSVQHIFDRIESSLIQTDQQVFTVEFKYDSLVLFSYEKFSCLFHGFDFPLTRVLCTHVVASSLRYSVSIQLREGMCPQPKIE